MFEFDALRYSLSGTAILANDLVGEIKKREMISCRSQMIVIKKHKIFDLKGTREREREIHFPN